MPASDHRVILLHPEAPPKPAEGQPCNGCGVCCAAEPCPMGALLSRRRQGACVALDWPVNDTRYRCGVLTQPSRWLPWLPAAMARRLARRLIAAGSGCDASLVALPSAPAQPEPAAPGQP
jgi:hypothetical protein